jgi:cation diffusion facilitator CzcD-associated flavoprotein CzcO
MTSKRLNACEVAVIGAGPYGLSVAAHLRQSGLTTKVFGEPMSFWRRHMPKGMRLRSPWRATHIADPGGEFSLDAFAVAQRADRSAPLMLESFIAYGEWFCGHAVGDVDRRAVRSVEATGTGNGNDNGFQIALADGEIFAAHRVVIATGLANQDYRPPVFAGLPATLVSHACDHGDLAPFRAKHVAVIGRGQSATESAALLAEAGAEAELISRGDVHWLGEATAEKSAMQQIHDALAAPSAVGPFPLSWLAEAPALVRYMPFELRDWFSKRCLKAGAAGWLKPRFANVTCNAGRTIVGVRAETGRIVLELDNGPRPFDHVLLGTGYRIDISRIGILSPKLLDKIARVDGSPLLRAGLESSVPGLHFVGSSAVKSFGPLMRFVAGASYAARAVSRAALVRRAERGDAGLSPALSSNTAPPR